MPHYRGFKKFLIGSQWVDPHGIIDHVVSNPANGEEIGVVRLADDLDIDRAVAAARGAWENRVWSDLTLEQRAEKVGAARDYCAGQIDRRSEEHTSELQSLMRISYAVFCLNKKR